MAWDFGFDLFRLPYGNTTEAKPCQLAGPGICDLGPGAPFPFLDTGPDQDHSHSGRPGFAQPGSCVGIYGTGHDRRRIITGVADCDFLAWIWHSSACLLPPDSKADLSISSRFALGAGSALEWLRPSHTSTPEPTPRTERMGIGSWVLSAILLVALLTALVAALAPPTARDSLWYHLSIPKAYAFGHGLYEMPDHLMSYAPLRIEVQFLWAMLVGGTEAGGMGEKAAGFLGAALGILSCFLVWEWTQSLQLKRFWSLAAAASIATVPTSWAVATNAYVDLAAPYTWLLPSMPWLGSGNRRGLVGCRESDFSSASPSLPSSPSCIWRCPSLWLC
jgi:hypothetical protein